MPRKQWILIILMRKSALVVELVSENLRALLSLLTVKRRNHTLMNPCVLGAAFVALFALMMLLLKGEDDD